MAEADEQVRPYVDCVGSEFLRWAVVATKRSCQEPLVHVCRFISEGNLPGGCRCTETQACRRI